MAEEVGSPRTTPEVPTGFAAEPTVVVSPETRSKSASVGSASKTAPTMEMPAPPVSPCTEFPASSVTKSVPELPEPSTSIAGPVAETTSALRLIASAVFPAPVAVASIALPVDDEKSLSSIAAMKLAELPELRSMASEPEPAKRLSEIVTLTLAPAPEVTSMALRVAESSRPRISTPVRLPEGALTLTASLAAEACETFGRRFAVESKTVVGPVPPFKPSGTERSTPSPRSRCPFLSAIPELCPVERPSP